MKLCIVIFGFRRKTTLINLISKLEQQAKNIPIYLYIDGPLTSNDILVADDIQSSLSSTSLHIIKRKFNLGLDGNIISGINELFKYYDYLIYIEDDIDISSDFVEYYIKSIPFISSGKYSYVTAYNQSNNNKNHYFLGAECLTWITNKSNWDKFNNCSKSLLESINLNFISKLRNINLNNYKVLIHQAIYNPQIWANNLYISCVLNNQYTFVPRTSKATHIGRDIYATNYRPIIDFSNVNISAGTINFNEAVELINNEAIFFKVIIAKLFYFKYQIKLLYFKFRAKLSLRKTYAVWNRNLGEEMRIHTGLLNNDVVIEVGANDSSYILDILEKNNYLPEIHAFEPCRYYDKFRLNHDRVKYYDFALTDYDGTAKLTRDFAGGSIAKDVNNNYDVVKVQKISSFINKFDSITVLNMNIEGAEYECIYDLFCSNQLSKIKYIYIQFHTFNKQELRNKKILIENLLMITHQCCWSYDEIWSKYTLRR